MPHMESHRMVRAARPLLLLLLLRSTACLPVTAYDSERLPIQVHYRTCEEVIDMCRKQCNSDHQCDVACVACPKEPRDNCWVQPDQCKIHMDG